MGEPTIRELDSALTDISGKVAHLQVTVTGIEGTVADQRDVLQSVQGLKDTVDQLAKRFNALFPEDESGESKFYSPIPTPRFWQLSGRDRELAIERLAAWVEGVYRGQFGFLAARLPACWAQHDFCLVVLDIASELHSCLWLTSSRNQGLLAGQGEFVTRLLPSLADLMVSEGKCEHHQGIPRIGVAR
jgi:hypothetical protein